MTPVVLPEGYRCESLRKDHPRRGFDCAQSEVTDWLRIKALQNQDKHLSATTVLIGPDEEVAGYSTLAIGQVDFSELPPDISRRLPRRALPVAVLSCLGVNTKHKGKGLGDRPVGAWDVMAILTQAVGLGYRICPVGGGHTFRSTIGNTRIGRRWL